MTVGRLGGQSTKHCRFMDGQFGRHYYTILYAIECATANVIKFGHTSNIKKRFGQLRHANGAEIKLLGHAWLPVEAEASAHTLLADHRSHGEWFHINADTRGLAALLASKMILELSDVLQMNNMLVIRPKPEHLPSDFQSDYSDTVLSQDEEFLRSRQEKALAKIA